jgi:hypothetical protein
MINFKKLYNIYTNNYKKLNKELKIDLSINIKVNLNKFPHHFFSLIQILLITLYLLLDY